MTVRNFRPTDWAPACSLILCSGTTIRNRADVSFASVWGSGTNATCALPDTLGSVHSVRGPFTFHRLWDEKQWLVPPVYGDVMLLLARYYHPRHFGQKRYKLGLIPHPNQIDSPQLRHFLEKHSDCLLIDLYHTAQWTDTIDAICCCERIVSSSLLGLVISDSYAVPNLWVDFSLEGASLEHCMPFVDYMLSVGRTDTYALQLRTVSDIEAAFATERFRCAPDIDDTTIIRSFPFQKHLRSFVYDRILPTKQWFMAAKADESAETTALLTIITPVRNGARYLAACAESLRKQTFQSWEWIVVDGHSNDGTADILRRLSEEDDRIRPIFTIHRGVSYSRNVALEHVHTPFVTFLDADDMYAHSECLANAMELLEGCGPRTLLKMSSYRYLSDKACYPYRKMKEACYTGEDVKRAVLEETTALVWDSIFTADLLVHRRFISYTMYEDMVFIYRIFPDVSCLITTDRSGYLWRKHPESTSAHKLTPWTAAEMMEAMYVALRISKELHLSQALLQAQLGKLRERLCSCLQGVVGYPQAYRLLISRYEEESGEKWQDTVPH